MVHVDRLRADGDVPGIGMGVGARSSTAGTCTSRPRARIDRADVALGRDADDDVAIGRAFMLYEPPTPGRGAVWFAIQRIEIDGVQVYGAVAPPLTLDGSVEGLTATSR